MSKSLEIYIDGASKGNPGPAGVGIVIFQDGKKLKEISKTIGNTTNNVAEYTALIFALEEAKELSAEEIKFFTDSELVYKQLTGSYKVKNPNIAELFNRANDLAKDFKYIEIKHIDREKNKDADRLASFALKKKQAKMVAPLFHKSREESPSSKG